MGENWAIELILELYERHFPPEKRFQQVADEMVRQMIYDLPPSEGLPDVRPNYLRFEVFKERN